ncbi:protein-tyrosine phosphatase family protein [Paludisphaera soli]|uniref:protein-tyrosine phosphatase family protein n=1 Tax=Paludisphaera soli TaxID=2712865 RepID=UPI0013ECFE74|nr:dual specificity protein phosphatase family protein [Paludisphaera soli]
MRHPLTLGLAAAGLGVLAGRDLAAGSPVRGAIAIGEAYLAISLATLASAYALRAADSGSARILDRTGRVGALRPLLLPYRAVASLALLVAGAVGREPARHVLGDGLVVGRPPFRWEIARLRREGIDAVLNLCWEFDGLPPGVGLATARVSILDATPPTPRQFDEAVERVARWRSEGRRVLIHCAQGHGRTATIAAACLVRLGLAADAATALQLVRSARSGARPSSAQEAALTRYVGGSRPA